MKQEENAGNSQVAPLGGQRVAARVLGVTEFSERARASLKSQLADGVASAGHWPFTSCTNDPELATSYKKAGELGYQKGLDFPAAQSAAVIGTSEGQNSPSTFGPIYHILP